MGVVIFMATAGPHRLALHGEDLISPGGLGISLSPAPQEMSAVPLRKAWGRLIASTCGCFAGCILPQRLSLFSVKELQVSGLDKSSHIPPTVTQSGLCCPRLEFFLLLCKSNNFIVGFPSISLPGTPGWWITTTCPAPKVIIPTLPLGV